MNALKLGNFVLRVLVLQVAIVLLVAGTAKLAEAQGFRGRGGSSGSRGSGPAEFLKRLDRNGNGMIDPDEMQGPARSMLERFKREMPQLDLSKPVPISQLSQALERMRDRSSRGSDSRNSSSRGSSRSSRSSRGDVTTPEIETLVPGFGVELELEPVPGFGEGSELFSVEINDQDLRYAESRFRRYDRNKDGYLSKEELSSGRWSEDPLKFDRNGDGRLTKEEMAVRYAQRRLARSDGDRGSRGGDDRGANNSNEPKFFLPSSTTSGSSSGSSGPSGGDNGATNDRTSRIVDFMLSRYDTNKNGVLERDEWSNMRTDPSPGDRNRDGKLDRGELTAFMASRYGGSGGSSGRGGSRSGDGNDRRSRWGGRGGDNDNNRGGSRFYTGSRDNDSNDTADRSTNDGDKRSYRMPTAIERLEANGLDDDLPDWFFQNDANSDGQVAMSEFAAAWSDRDAAEFQKFDLNNDGLITATECLAAVQAGKVRGVVSSGSSSRTAAATRSTTKTSNPSGSDDTARSADSAEASDEIPTLYMRYAVGLINKYDDNSDGMLEASEWSAHSKDISPADVDGDGKITPTELARFHMPGGGRKDEG